MAYLEASLVIAETMWLLDFELARFMIRLGLDMMDRIWVSGRVLAYRCPSRKGGTSVLQVSEVGGITYLSDGYLGEVVP